jgi:hypothetical protein
MQRFTPWDPYDRERRSDPDFEFVRGRAYPHWANGGSIRPRDEYPYSYSFFITHGPVKKFEGVGIGGAYSDRMSAWDHDAWQNAWAAVAPKRHYNELSLDDLSRFLTAYHLKTTKCLQVLEGCNVSNGYPLWYFVWEQVPAQGGEARQGGDSAASSVHEHPVPEGDAPLTPCNHKDSPHG